MPGNKDKSATKNIIGDFSGRIKELLKTETQSSLAEKSGLGVSDIKNFVGGSIPGIDKAAALKEGLNLNWSWLMKGEGPVYENPDNMDIETILSSKVAQQTFLDMETVKNAIIHYETIRKDMKDSSPEQIANAIMLMSILFSGAVGDQDPDKLADMLTNM